MRIIKKPARAKIKFATFGKLPMYAVLKKDKIRVFSQNVTVEIKKKTINKKYFDLCVGLKCSAPYFGFSSPKPL